ncbi:MAG: peptide MFS transporter [bacterium]|nr:peptide MFS transporter [bacterium]
MSSVTVNDPNHAMNQRQVFGHPAGLYILFFTELWERFSYYGMRALFVLFLTAEISAENAGFGWTRGEALSLYGWYTMLVYVASIPGGILADKVFGQKKMVVIGGILLCIGHGVLAIEGMWAWYAGISLIILGVGGLKPNISTMVGGLYKQGDERRDIAFTIFYIGINLGAFAAGLIIGPLGENVNWHYGFGLAGIGMVIGQAMFVWGTRYLKGVGELEEKNEESDEPKGPSYISKLFANKLALALNVVVLLLGAYIIYAGSFGYGLLVMGVSFFVGFFTLMLADLEGIEKDRVVVLVLSYLIVIIFWGAFEQAGGLMNLYASEKTDRLITIFNLDLIFGVAIAALAIRGIIGKMKKQENFMYWFIGTGVLAFMFFALRTLVFTKGGDGIPEGMYLVPATVFQSVNSFFIFTLGTMIALYWYNRKMKGKESGSLFKMAWGVIIMGLGFTFMSIATKEWEATGGSGMVWLVLAYMFHTIGELCQSPVAMSFITKLAPAKYVSIMMGFYFAATGFGNKLAGALGEYSEKAGEFEIFTGITIFCVVFGALVLLLMKPLKRLTHGAEDLQEEAA